MLKNQILKNNDSWAIRWEASNFLANKLSLYPGQSLVKNVGFDGSGIHCSTTDIYDVALADREIVVSNIQAIEYTNARLALRDYYIDMRYDLSFIRVKRISLRLFRQIISSISKIFTKW